MSHPAGKFVSMKPNAHYTENRVYPRSLRLHKSCQDAAITGFNQFLADQQETRARQTTLSYSARMLRADKLNSVQEIVPLTTYLQPKMHRAARRYRQDRDDLGLRLAALPRKTDPGR